MLNYGLHPRQKVPQSSAPGLDQQEPIPIWIKGLIKNPPGSGVKTATPKRTVRLAAHVDQRDPGPNQGFVQIFIRAVIFPVSLLKLRRGVFQMQAVAREL